MQRRDIAERTSRLAAQLTIVSASVLFKGYCEGVKLGFGERDREIEEVCVVGRGDDMVVGFVGCG